MCVGIDPYKLRIGKDAALDVDLLPAVTHGDIVNYLVLSTSHVTLQQMVAYKLLDGHNYFTSGWVKSIAAKQLPSQRVVVLSEVTSLVLELNSRSKLPVEGRTSCVAVPCRKRASATQVEPRRSHRSGESKQPTPSSGKLRRAGQRR
ncbi:hypothetical protein HPB52_004931 [Rhipicephalus sanguineus]|uniref:Uncharacterized protein n=1 Tax=Rhipicephalus sanguineus TaxID=34632 RepID=A0A9D4T749_RHISA|nr:hypothetical protein HPB52_004931 [Rhipicephalus sanguineus]